MKILLKYSFRNSCFFYWIVMRNAEIVNKFLKSFDSHFFDWYVQLSEYIKHFFDDIIFHNIKTENKKLLQYNIWILKASLQFFSLKGKDYFCEIFLIGNKKFKRINKRILWIILYHDNVYQSIYKSVLKYPLYKICIWERDIPISISFFLTQDSYFKEWKNWFVLKIEAEEKELFYMIFFIGKTEIFISTQQFFYKNTKLYLVGDKFHKITYYTLWNLAKLLGKRKIVCFSNTTHPFSKIKNTEFFWLYDNYCTSFWMKKDMYWFFEANILWDLDLNINEFVEYNISKKICPLIYSTLLNK